MKFKEMNLIMPLLQAIKEEGFVEPSPIQEKTIPLVLEGKDILGCAQTGTGKTAAFALPILQRLSTGKGSGVRALIITPTRELAIQVYESFECFGKYTKLKQSVIYGGVGQSAQVNSLKSGVDILIATPGRLNDLIGQGYITLDSIEMFVLDEADQMLDMGFLNDIKKVIKLLPKKRQTLLFSATMPKEIEALATGLLHNPEIVKISAVTSTVDSIEQSVYFVDRLNKLPLLTSLIKEQKMSSVLVFTKTKHGADRVADKLNKAKVKALAIHGDKGQNARQSALSDFKEGRIRVLVATDIAARGIDISELSFVVNYDIPNQAETYIHRIGRTGRAGLGGKAINLCNIDDLDYLREIEKHIGKIIPEVTSKWPMLILEKTEKPVRGQKTGNSTKNIAKDSVKADVNDSSKADSKEIKCDAKDLIGRETKKSDAHKKTISKKEEKSKKSLSIEKKNEVKSIISPYIDTKKEENSKKYSSIEKKKDEKSKKNLTIEKKKDEKSKKYSSIEKKKEEKSKKNSFIEKKKEKSKNNSSIEKKKEEKSKKNSSIEKKREEKNKKFSSIKKITSDQARKQSVVGKKQ